MAKIMLVEDDNSLREIYEARLMAEGYEVVSAKDGEEALATALKEHPDLIIADIMMPKVSGFDMLDILRSTPETKNTKIIMMTALSQAEDRQRAEKLGADRYLVKSQVTLEDVTREARNIIDELERQAHQTVSQVGGQASNNPKPAPVPPAPPATAPKPTPNPAPKPEPKPSAPPKPEPKPTEKAEPSSSQPTITSIPVTAPDDDDTNSDAALEAAAEKLSTPVKKETKEVDEQVDEFIASNPTLSTSPEPNNEAVTNAMDSLTSKPDASESDKTKEKDDSSRGYVADKTSSGGPKANDSVASSGSLQHTKTITPTPEAQRSEGKPDLQTLLAKEGETMGDSSTPAVNSIINPDNT